MGTYLVVLRLLHIVAGAFWFGSTLAFVLFVEPTASALRQEAQPFMAHLMRARRYSQVIGWVALVTIVAGALLYWEVSDGLNRDWVESRTGTTFTVGALAAIVAYVLGLTVARPTALRLAGLAAGGPPSPETLATMQRLGGRLRTVGRVNAALLTLSVAAMAVARYVPVL